jgi:CRP-like cAMP-binding protein
MAPSWQAAAQRPQPLHLSWSISMILRTIVFLLFRCSIVLLALLQQLSYNADRKSVVFPTNGEKVMENYAIVARSPLFAGIAGDDLPGLLKCVSARRERFRKNQILLRRGEKTNHIGVVLAGTVHIIREDFWGNRSIVGLVGPGDLFAESYALTEEPLEVSALAATDGEVLFLDSSRIVSGCQNVCGFHAQLSRNMVAVLAGKNLALTAKMRHMARKTTREKLMSYLSAQALRVGRPEFEIPMDRQQLADFLGVERSAMSAALGKLRDEGVLEFRKNHFRLLKIGDRDD